MNLMWKRCPSSRLPYLVPLQSHLCPPSPPFLFLLIPHSLSLPLVYSPQAKIGFLEESIFQSIFHWKIIPNSLSKKGDSPIDAAYSIAMDPKGQEGANWLYASKERRNTRRKVTTRKSSERQGNRSSSVVSELSFCLEIACLRYRVQWVLWMMSYLFSEAGRLSPCSDVGL
jgi:hypothetical protein